MSSRDRGIFLENSIKLFRNYQSLGEKAMAQLTVEEVLRKPNEESNSIALIVHHLSGNMQSRFTDFMTTDGEKPWRNREQEFDEAYADKAAMMTAWEKGWQCLYAALEPLRESDLTTIVYIRHEGQTVLEAIQRQLAHYASHIGQIIFQAKAIKGSQFQSLSIPRGGSDAFNKAKFSQEKTRRDFTPGRKLKGSD